MTACGLGGVVCLRLGLFLGTTAIGGEMGEWVTSIITQALVEVAERVCSLLYKIWRVRNLCYFKGREMCWWLFMSLPPIYRSTMILILWTPSPCSARKWELLPVGTFKLNSDAACRGDAWSMGTVIRDEDGNVQEAMALKSTIQQGVAVAEALGVLDGVKLELRTNVRRLQVESDCEKIIKEILSLVPSNTYLGAVAMEIRRLSLQFDVIDFSRVYTT